MFITVTWQNNDWVRFNPESVDYILLKKVGSVYNVTLSSWKTFYQSVIQDESLIEELRNLNPDAPDIELHHADADYIYIIPNPERIGSYHDSDDSIIVVRFIVGNKLRIHYKDTSERQYILDVLEQLEVLAEQADPSRCCDPIFEAFKDTACYSQIIDAFDIGGPCHQVLLNILRYGPNWFTLAAIFGGGPCHQRLVEIFTTGDCHDDLSDIINGSEENSSGHYHIIFPIQPAPPYNRRDFETAFPKLDDEYSDDFDKLFQNIKFHSLFNWTDFEGFNIVDAKLDPDTHSIHIFVHILDNTLRLLDVIRLIQAVLKLHFSIFRRYNLSCYHIKPLKRCSLHDMLKSIEEWKGNFSKNFMKLKEFKLWK